MAILPIITAPDPRLKKISAAVEDVDDDLRRLMDDMRDTMYQAPGIGLAAIQVGVARRAIVIDLAREKDRQGLLHLVNPEILWASEETVSIEEGCLSLPDHYAEVERSVAIRISHLDYHGTARELEARDVLATCIQHEMDHLEGILFVDHLSAIRRGMILRKLAKMRKLETAG